MRSAVIYHKCLKSFTEIDGFDFIERSYKKNKLYLLSLDRVALNKWVERGMFEHFDINKEGIEIDRDICTEKERIASLVKHGFLAIVDDEEDAES